MISKKLYFQKKNITKNFFKKKNKENIDLNDFVFTLNSFKLFEITIKEKKLKTFKFDNITIK